MFSKVGKLFGRGRKKEIRDITTQDGFNRKGNDGSRGRQESHRDSDTGALYPGFSFTVVNSVDYRRGGSDATSSFMSNSAVQEANDREQQRERKSSAASEANSVLSNVEERKYSGRPVALSTVSESENMTMESTGELAMTELAQRAFDGNLGPASEFDEESGMESETESEGDSGSEEESGSDSENEDDGSDDENNSSIPSMLRESVESEMSYHDVDVEVGIIPRPVSEQESDNEDEVSDSADDVSEDEVDDFESEVGELPPIPPNATRQLAASTTSALSVSSSPHSSQADIAVQAGESTETPVVSGFDDSDDEESENESVENSDVQSEVESEEDEAVSDMEDSGEDESEAEDSDEVESAVSDNEEGDEAESAVSDNEEGDEAESAVSDIEEGDEAESAVSDIEEGDEAESAVSDIEEGETPESGVEDSSDDDAVESDVEESDDDAESVNESGSEVAAIENEEMNDADDSESDSESTADEPEVEVNVYETDDEPQADSGSESEEEESEDSESDDNASEGEDDAARNRGISEVQSAYGSFDFDAQGPEVSLERFASVAASSFGDSDELDVLDGIEDDIQGSDDFLRTESRISMANSAAPSVASEMSRKQTVRSAKSFHRIKEAFSSSSSSAGSSGGEPNKPQHRRGRSIKDSFNKLVHGSSWKAADRMNDESQKPQQGGSTFAGRLYLAMTTGRWYKASDGKWQQAPPGHDELLQSSMPQPVAMNRSNTSRKSSRMSRKNSVRSHRSTRSSRSHRSTRSRSSRSSRRRRDDGATKRNGADGPTPMSPNRWIKTGGGKWVPLGNERRATIVNASPDRRESSSRQSSRPRSQRKSPRGHEPVSEVAHKRYLKTQSGHWSRASMFLRRGSKRVNSPPEARRSRNVNARSPPSNSTPYSPVAHNRFNKTKSGRWTQRPRSVFVSMKRSMSRRFTSSKGTMEEQDISHFVSAPPFQVDGGVEVDLEYERENSY